MAGIYFNTLAEYITLGPEVFDGAVLTAPPRQRDIYDRVAKASTGQHEGYNFEVALPALGLEKVRVLVEAPAPANKDPKADPYPKTFTVMRPVAFDGLHGVEVRQDYDNPRVFTVSARAKAVKQGTPAKASE